MKRDIEQLDLHILGQSAEEFEISPVSELSAISLDFVLQCTRTIRIVSRHLDPNIYDNDVFIEALNQFIRRSRYSNIEILVHDSMPAVHSNHKLILLHQRLSSYIKIRQINKDFKDYNHAFLLADEAGYIFRQFADRPEATVNYNNPLKNKTLTEKFIEIWEVSEPDPQVRRLYL